MISSSIFIQFLCLTALALVSRCWAGAACYGQGIKRRCFSDSAPFNGRPLPQDPYGEIAPTYHLFRERTNTSRVINSSLELNLQNGLFIVIHGWMGDFPNTAPWHMPLITNLVEKFPSTDVMFLEWKNGASADFGNNPYDRPASNTRSIAAHLVDFLLDNKEFNASNSHCIGFSLGSHLCGFAGKRLKASGVTYGWGRLTALDPAFPSFDNDNPMTRVDRTDAEFVDAIHTSRLGLFRPVADVDFYVSGAVSQPGCRYVSGRRRRSIFSQLVDWFEDTASCSHVRAPLIFAETILAQPNYNLSGVITDYTRPGPGSCTFSKFCPCRSLADYQRGQCRSCNPSEAQMVGFWCTTRPYTGSFFGELTANPPFCVQA